MSREGVVLSHVYSVTKLLKPAMRNGYHSVFLYEGVSAKRFNIHRLVALAYLPNPDNKATVNHIDGNKLNNSVRNLEWATQAENIQHAIRTGLRNAVPYSKLDLEQVRSIKLALLSPYLGINRDLAMKYHISNQTISCIKLGQIWSNVTIEE